VRCIMLLFRAGALLLCVCAVSVSDGQRAKTIFGYTPFTDDGLPLAAFTINGSVTGNFVVDTGSNSTVITEELASRLRLKRHALVNDDGTPIHMPDGKQAMGDDVDILFGTFPVRGQVVIVPTESLQANRSVQVDGLIGYNLLSYATVLFDFPKNQITVWFPGGLTEEEIRSIGLSGSTIVTPSVDPVIGWTVPVTLNGTTHIDLVVDTGGGRTNIPSAVATGLKLKTVKRGIHSRSIYGPMVTSRAIVDTLAIGSLTLTNQPVEFAKRDQTPFIPLLGMPTLRQFRLLLDYPAKRFYFAKPASSRQPREGR
jgi:hypothetical protein